MKLTSTLGIVVAFGLLVQSPVIAQPFQIRVPSVPVTCLDDDLTATELEVMLSLMRVHIDAIHRVVGLDEMSERKLAVAATAAVASTFQNAEIKIYSKSTVSGVGDLDSQENALSDEHQELSPELREFRLGYTRTKYREPGMLAVLEQPLWKKTLQKVLTESQQAKLKEHWTSRNHFTYTMAIHNYITTLERYLLLFPEQREAIADVIEKAIVDCERSGCSISVYQRAFWLHENNKKSRLNLKFEQLKPILTQSQIAELKRLKQGGMAIVVFEDE